MTPTEQDRRSAEEAFHRIRVALKYGDWDEWPEDLRVREVPTP